MAVTLKNLFQENASIFKLSLCAGQNGINNVVSWVYMLEDEYIIPYFHGAELAVTTCMKFTADASWLHSLIDRLITQRAAGLIINTGKFIFEIPDDIRTYCDVHAFPVFTVPWEIKITNLIQDFCISIINGQHESVIHDKAMRDAILKRDNESEYRDILAKYYHLDEQFIVISIYIRQTEGEPADPANTEYLLETRLRRLKKEMSLPQVRIGIIAYETYTLLILNNVPDEMLLKIRDVILDVYSAAVAAHTIFTGIGIEVTGIENIDKSYNRAITAMRMARYRNEPAIRFEEMGFYKILFSVKDEDVLYAYASEILAPLDKYDEKNHDYVELLKVYIQHDRSLEGTARAMYLHRNTVNYRVQKMKELLGSPLKTVEDLFPYQVALAIRDMEKHTQNDKKHPAAAEKKKDI